MKQTDKLKELRHSAAHLLAHALTELFPEVQLTIGPATDDGFFYDFLLPFTIKESDLVTIEQKMHEIADRDLPITHYQMAKKEAQKLYTNNPFKSELINALSDDTVGIAQQGDFLDLCKGGHVASTGIIKHFKLLALSGSYWRADKDNVQLQRIYGTAFFSQKELRNFEKRRQEALRYDHRRLGKELDLFSFHHEGTGFPFFHPDGNRVMRLLMNYLRSILEESGYQEISTPIMLSQELWKQSGHYDHYKENMYFCSFDDYTYAIRPMNCPGAILVYKERPRSYRQLPLRLSEFGLVHRYELSGVLHGLFRARSFTIDDAHIFCTPEQIEQEVTTTITMIRTVLQKFHFDDITVYLSTKPDNAMGSDALWQQATEALHNALQTSETDYTIQEGEGAFYGPKIEFHIQDSLGRSWQCSTIQLDFFLPNNFDLSYVTSDDVKARPVIIHRAIYGSLERFFGILLEHYKGNLPVWIAPTQATVLTITSDQNEYAQSIVERLKSENIRVIIDTSSNPISGKIKSAQLARTPLMLIIGKKEVENQTVSIRYLDGKQEFGLDIAQLIELIQA